MAKLPTKSIVSKTASDKEEVNGYGNIKVSVKNKQGVIQEKTIGIYGLMLRDSNKLEHAILEMARQGNLDGIDSLQLSMTVTLVDDDSTDDDEIVFA